MSNTKNKLNLLLDVDGVLADFMSGALKELNRKFNRSVTIEEYAKWGQWGTYDYYGITVEQFWGAIEENPSFWMNLEPYPWTYDLYKHLKSLGDVTILTAPSNDPDCSKQKYAWLSYHLGIGAKDIMMGHKKYLMAGHGILVDDYHKNVDAFVGAGGQAIKIPSNWNTPNLNWTTIKNVIDKSLIDLI